MPDVAMPDVALPDAAMPVGVAKPLGVVCGEAGSERVTQHDKNYGKKKVSSHGNKSFERLVSARKTKVFRRGCPSGVKQTKNCFLKRFVFGRKINVF